MRVFAALPIPEVVIAQLFSLRLRLSEARDGLRWSTPEQWHITLQFFGDVAEQELLTIEKALTQIVALPFEVELNGFGLFASKGILYTAVEASTGLVALQRQVVQRSAAHGFPEPMQAFLPHLTMARSKGKTGARTLARLTQPRMPAFGPPLRWTARECWLLESTLSPQGAVYTERRRIAFAASGERPAAHAGTAGDERGVV